MAISDGVPSSSNIYWLNTLFPIGNNFWISDAFWILDVTAIKSYWGFFWILKINTNIDENNNELIANIASFEIL